MKHGTAVLYSHNFCNIAVLMTDSNTLTDSISCSCAVLSNLTMLSELRILQHLRQVDRMLFNLTFSMEKEQPADSSIS